MGLLGSVAEGSLESVLTKVRFDGSVKVKKVKKLGKRAFKERTFQTKRKPYAKV